MAQPVKSKKPSEERNHVFNCDWRSVDDKYRVFLTDHSSPQFADEDFDQAFLQLSQWLIQNRSGDHCLSLISPPPVRGRSDLFTPELAKIGYDDGVEWRREEYEAQFVGGICPVCHGPRGSRNGKAATIMNRPQREISSLANDRLMRLLVSSRVKDFLQVIASQKICFIEAVLETGYPSGYFEVTAIQSIPFVACKSTRPHSGWICPECGRRFLTSFHPKLRNKRIKFLARADIVGQWQWYGAILANNGLGESVVVPYRLLEKQAIADRWGPLVLSPVAILEEGEIDRNPMLPSVIDVG